MRLEKVDALEHESISLDKGLTSKDAHKRLEKYGYNELEAKKKISAIKILIAQFNDFMTWILLGATLISGFMGEKADAVTILIIILINAILGFVQEFKTEKSLEALQSLASPTANVIRDGKIQAINAREVVPGDILIVEAGDRIAADSVLIEGFGVQSDESILTGESVPVEKFVHKGNSNIGNKNSLFMGCTVISGRGKVKVIATGMSTEMGKIADMLGEIETKQTPLQEKLDHLGKVLVVGCLVVCAAVTITGIIRGEDVYRMFLVGVSLAVAAIPEGLPAIVTVSLALGVQRMMKKKALVRKLQAVETLGCTKVICSDKTGTLTQNKMTIKKIYTIDNYYEVSGSGYDISGNITKNDSRVNLLSDLTLKRTLECGVVCNNASISEPKRGGVPSYVGDPTEISFVILGEKAFGNRNLVKNQFRRIKENPFDSDRKMMSVLCEENGNKRMFSKGATERVLSRCTYALVNGEVVKINSTFREKVIEASNKMAEEALRVLALAYKDADSIVEDNLIFLGLAGMIDPPREEVKDAILECRLAGITPVMITGDHKLTAQAIADKLGMIEKDSMVITGEELDRMSDAKLDSVINKIRVFARVSPSHKYRIVKAFKRKDQVVAMTGDGVNDAPAIKEADIGIAMGIQGTDVTKEASSMILLDDNFTTIVEAVKEGRVIYDNIRKFLRYLLACNIGEVLTMFIASLMSLPIPLLPIQILLVNLATDGLPAMALSLEKGEKDVMMRKARNKNEGIFANGLWSKIVLRGALIGVSTVVAFAVTLVYADGNLKMARTVALCTLVMSQLFHVFECKSERNSVFKVGLFTNVYLILAVISSFALLMLIVYTPWMQSIFHTQGLGILNWGVVLLLSGAISLISSLFWYKK
ncbi:calcium-translocating P-type ATPase, SERCA-type [Clostridium cylindrosporum]|uniref:Calcium-transporting ATPase YloB n=1 Tax=Clostridium cylindrosporum DSM 605 TaxID=1121307 RepID=A0A0J8D5H0_CLOCY|nr:calcium-translocating P-type ATPase, SERCA-type [Clostridium cylindrosporum]KMT21390.1 calcium-transporting ATPase YloB [Clostridium cylindrosporum DSM 605]